MLEYRVVRIVGFQRRSRSVVAMPIVAIAVVLTLSYFQ